MKILSTKTMDFGHLKITEKKCETESESHFYLLDLIGFFDGFQEGPSGRIGLYLDKEFLPNINQIIFNMEQLDFFADVALSIVVKWKRIYQKKDGDFLLAAPKSHIADMLDILKHPYFKTVEEAVSFFE